MNIQMKSRPWALEGVDIIIPFHGQYDAVKSSIRGIYMTTSEVPFQVILVDDGSPNPHFLSMLRDESKKLNIANMKFVRQDHSGYGAAINSGLKESEFNHVCLMDSDAVPENSSWLKNLMVTMHSAPGIGMVSARLDVPPQGRSLVAGKKGQKLARKVIRQEGIAQMLEGDSYLPLSCVLCDGRMLKSIGGLSEYPLAMYEDAEVAVRMFRSGKKQAIAGDSFVKHAGGLTINSLATKEENRRIMEENYERCLEDIGVASQK